MSDEESLLRAASSPLYRPSLFRIKVANAFQHFTLYLLVEVRLQGACLLFMGAMFKGPLDSETLPRNPTA